MWKSPSPIAKSPRTVQTNAPEYQKMLQEQDSGALGISQPSAYITPPNATGGRNDPNYPFQTPRPSASRAVRKEKVPEHELSALRNATLSAPSYHGRGTIQAIPESSVLALSEVSRHTHDHHHSMSHLSSTSAQHFQPPPRLGNKQWHSCMDINEQGYFHELPTEITINQSGFRDDTFFQSPKRERHYGNLLEQYNGLHVTHQPYNKYEHSSAANMSSGSYTSMQEHGHSRSSSPSRSPPRMQSPNKLSTSKSSLQKSVPIKTLFEPRKDPRLEMSGSYSHAYDSSNYSTDGFQADSVASHGFSPPTEAKNSSGMISSELTKWQQKHQLQLKKQQMETSTQYDAEDPYKWDALKRAADSIIKEKDLIIDKLKSKLQAHELKERDHEDQIKMALSLGSRDSSQVKLQEYQLASAHAQMLESVKSKDEEISQLEQKLGAMESENQQMKESMKDKASLSDEELGRLKKQLMEKERSVSEWQEKHQEVCDDYKTLKKKLQGLESYLADLPTQDDHSKKSQELKSLKENEVVYKTRLADLELSLSDLQTVLKTKDTRIQCLIQKEEDLGTQIDGLKLELERLKEPEKQGKLETDELSDIDDLRWENQKLKSDFEKAKKVLENRHRKYQQVEVKHQTRVKQLEEQISQDEVMMNALRDEMSGKDDQLKKLQISIKELGKQNQDLMEKNMILQDKGKELDRLLSSDHQKLERKLIREMNSSVSELQSLTQICKERAEGQDPNISVLLGVRASTVMESEEEGNRNDTQALKQRLIQVRKLREDIDKMRQLISNKYAEDMGDNLNCITQ